MNNTFKQILQSAIHDFIYCDNKEVDKSKLHFICKFSRLGLRLDNDIPDDIKNNCLIIYKTKYFIFIFVILWNYKINKITSNYFNKFFIV